MKNDTLYNCSLCKKDYPRKKVQVINGVVKCKLCKQKKRLEKRESFKRNVFGVRKAEQQKECKRTKQCDEAIHKERPISITAKKSFLPRANYWPGRFRRQ